MNETTILSLIPLLPLAGALLSYWAGIKNRASAGYIATAAALLSFAAVLSSFFALAQSGAGVIDVVLFRWFEIGKTAVDFAFRFDQLTAVMCLIITGIGSLIHIYSIGYMAEDASRHRFFAYLNLFLFSMLILVLGKNLLVLFVGWEGVGLCSYLLIGFWFKNKSFAEAGRKAFIVNRIGDAAFLIGMFVLLKVFNTLDIPELASICSTISPDALGMVGTFVAACLFFGATGKSAQIPLFVWLPDAMAGPTPVSALIHAATMVTAGVYLCARMHFLFDVAPLVTAVICFGAVATAFVAATIAITQNDIKKVLAYSTVSQLGFMFMAVSVGAYWAALFHVVTHAFFKACLFLGAGSVIHGCRHEQDMRKMGGLMKYMPITAVTYIISTLAIAGIYPFSGFHSKHAILAALAATTNEYLVNWQPLLSGIAAFTAFLTAFYMTRSVVMTFFGNYRGAHDDRDEQHHADPAHAPHESPFSMTFPLIVLAACATVAGVLLVRTLPEFLAPILGEVEQHHSGSILESFIDSWIGILGVFLGLVLYLKLPKIPAAVFTRSGLLGKFLQGKYFVDELYNFLIVAPLIAVSKTLWSGFDATLIDGFVNGTGACVEMSGEVARAAQTGQTRHYAFVMFVSAIFLIIFYLVL
jgi:NADH-quinone oxidoreductase subunit L